MKTITTTSKIFAFISLSTCAIWIGSYLVRLFSIYQLFESPDLTLKNYITEQNINGVLFSFLPVILTPFVSFILMIIAFLLFVITSKISLRENGWLFIIFIAVLITLPFEIYLMTIDYKIILMLNSSTFDASQIIILLRKRITALSSFPILVLFTYLSFFYFIVFKPLTKSIKHNV